MTLARHLALLLAAAFLVIAAGLLPSAVQAHPGHTVVQGATAVIDQPVTVLVDTTSFALPRSLSGQPYAGSDAWRADGRLSCANSCCLVDAHAGSCCCAIALAPAGDSAAIAPPANAPERRRDPQDFVEADPEAVPEPPRPLA